MLAHDGFKAIALSKAFACVAGAAAVRADNYRFLTYDELGSSESTGKLAVDLRDFIADFPLSPDRFASFIASFKGPSGLSAIDFEKHLWGTLQCLHDLDEIDWDPTVSSDPQDVKFSFSFHGRSFFVVGMHPASPRWTRRLAWPTLVFNAHAQFEELRRMGRFESLQRTIRRRDSRLQGSPNPALTDYGMQSEAKQYGGRVVEPDWKCPLVVRSKRDESKEEN
ncbi:MAG TPA: guanitoxin biosynthesis heme-dependent pre-guanitoxin N-hydroxylase GntA [Candidatus Limnocylindrales bacterium]|nr:guanitoxin biosynthesis heme-dependent pre-guanitoxin N-hydroxylase GntA [Candidatus Limnocylindrales bacterium]